MFCLVKLGFLCILFGYIMANLPCIFETKTLFWTRKIWCCNLENWNFIVVQFRSDKVSHKNNISSNPGKIKLNVTFKTQELHEVGLMSHNNDNHTASKWTLTQKKKNSNFKHSPRNYMPSGSQNRFQINPQRLSEREITILSFFQGEFTT